MPRLAAHLASSLWLSANAEVLLRRMLQAGPQIEKPGLDARPGLENLRLENSQLARLNLNPAVADEFSGVNSNSLAETNLTVPAS